MNNFIKYHLEKLKQNNFNYPEIELRAILKKTSISKKEILFSNFNKEQINLSFFLKAFERRMQKEPIAKIFNEKYFWKHKFYVNNHVLDPRPETEHIIEGVKKYFPNNKINLNIADLGTGSGCIAISLAKEYKNSNVTATDVSEEALQVAKKNSKKLKTNKQINFLRCDWINFSAFYDIIVTNPPYLSEQEFEDSSTEIKNYEPKKALVGGDDGLHNYRILAEKMLKIMNNNTISFVEIGNGQKAEVVKIFNSFLIKCDDIIVDHQNIDRILVLKKKKY